MVRCCCPGSGRRKSRWRNLDRFPYLGTKRRERLKMSEETKTCCEKGKDPKTCDAEQVKECHGETEKHACGEAEKACGDNAAEKKCG